MPVIEPFNGGLASHRYAEEVGAGAPDPAACVARPILRGESPAWCLAPQGRDCRFSQPFGDALLCCHPQRERIIVRKSSQS